MKLNILKPSITLRSRRRLRLTISMLSILPVAFLACDLATAENVTIRQVVLCTDESPVGAPPSVH